MVEVTVQSIQVSLMTDHRVILLKEIGSERVLPIWIGTHEAEAIAIRMRDVSVARPMTHDLLADVISNLGGEVAHITVNDLRNDTFYARITVRVNGHEVEDGRVLQDGDEVQIALAVRLLFVGAEATAPLEVSAPGLRRAGL